MQTRKVEITVGLFMLIVICSVLFLCLKVADTSSIRSGSTYRVYAVFDNVGGLKNRSPIKIGGVVIGRVNEVTLDTKNYKPYVAINIESKYNTIPSSSSLSIKTAGLLGEQYISVDLGVEQDVANEIDMLDALDSGAENSVITSTQPEYFVEGFVIHNTKPALVLEDLIGQFLYSSDSSADSKNDTK